MASSPDITSMALFCDFENVALGVRDTHHEKFDIKLVLEKLLLKGSIVVKKAYCDWERYKGFKATMHEANFELIEIPHVRQSGKNSADIRLVVDALDLCYTKAHVNTFVIISGDSDFSPLVSKLRENNKQVIGVGVKQSTSDLLIANCDEFIFYDDLVREGQRTSTRRESRPAQAAGRRPNAPSGNPEDDRKREEAESRRSKAVELALQTFEALYAERGDGGKIWASVLKEAIKRRKPDFSESYYGFRSFGGLLEEMQQRGFLEMGRDEKSNAYVFRSSAPAPQQQAQDAAPPAAPDMLPVTHRAGEQEPRGRGPRSRGGRRGGADRHDFEAPLSVDAQAGCPMRPTTRPTTPPSVSPTRRARPRRRASCRRAAMRRPRTSAPARLTRRQPPTTHRRAKRPRAAAAGAATAVAAALRRVRRRGPRLRQAKRPQRCTRRSRHPRQHQSPRRRPRRRQWPCRHRP